MNEYQIHDHIHLYASWAAGRASSVKNNRFKVEIAQKILLPTTYIKASYSEGNSETSDDPKP